MSPPGHRPPGAPRLPDLGSPTATAALLRSVSRIQDAWGLSEQELARLLGCSADILTQWRTEPPSAGLSDVTLLRISHLATIYVALHELFPDPGRADAWIRRPNQAPALRGRSALERMLDGDLSDLATIRQYLDAQRFGC